MTLYIWGGDVFENVFRRVQIEARECINWLWVRPFSGMRTTVIVAAMLVEQLELFPPLITIGNRMSHPLGELFALWPPLPLNPYWYSTDRAH